MGHLARYKLQSGVARITGIILSAELRDKKTFFPRLRPIPAGRIPEVAAKGTARIGGYLISGSSKGGRVSAIPAPLSARSLYRQRSRTVAGIAIRRRDE